MPLRVWLLLVLCAGLVQARLGGCQCLDDLCLVSECRWSRWVIEVLAESFVPPLLLGLILALCACSFCLSKCCCAACCGGSHPSRGMLCVSNRPVVYTRRQILFSKALGVVALALLILSLSFLMRSTHDYAARLFSVADAIDSLVDFISSTIDSLYSTFVTALSFLPQLTCTIAEHGYCTTCDPSNTSANAASPPSNATSASPCDDVGPFTCPPLECAPHMPPSRLATLTVTAPKIKYPDSTTRFCGPNSSNADCSVQVCADTCTQLPLQATTLVAHSIATQVYPSLAAANSSFQALRATTIQDFLTSGRRAADAIRALTVTLVVIVACTVTGAATFTLIALVCAVCNVRGCCVGVVMIAISLAAMNVWVMIALVYSLSDAVGQVCYETSLATLDSPSILTSLLGCDSFSLDFDVVVVKVVTEVEVAFQQACDGLSMLCCAAPYTFADAQSGNFQPSVHTASSWSVAVTRSGVASQVPPNRTILASLRPAVPFQPPTHQVYAGSQRAPVPPPGSCQKCPSTLSISSLSDFQQCKPLLCPAVPRCKTAGDVAAFVQHMYVNFDNNPCGEGRACSLAACAEHCSNSILKAVAGPLSDVASALSVFASYLDPLLESWAKAFNFRPTVALCHAVIAEVVSYFVAPCKAVHGTLGRFVVSVQIFTAGIVFALVFTALGWKRWRPLSHAGHPVVDDAGTDWTPLWRWDETLLPLPTGRATVWMGSGGDSGGGGGGGGGVDGGGEGDEGWMLQDPSATEEMVVVERLEVEVVGGEGGGVRPSPRRMPGNPSKLTS